MSESLSCQLAGFIAGFLQACAPEAQLAAFGDTIFDIAREGNRVEFLLGHGGDGYTVTVEWKEMPT